MVPFTIAVPVAGSEPENWEVQASAVTRDVEIGTPSNNVPQTVGGDGDAQVFGGRAELVEQGLAHPSLPSVGSASPATAAEAAAILAAGAARPVGSTHSRVPSS